MVRIVCLSDTHSKHGEVNVPDGEVLLYRGDATLVGGVDEIAGFNHWRLPNCLRQFKTD